MTTCFNLMELLQGGGLYDEKPSICIYDKTGSINFGTYVKGVDALPVWLKFVKIDSFKANSNCLFVSLADIYGDLRTRNDDIRAVVVGFDYVKEEDFFGKYYPEYIILKVNHIARCEQTVKKLKLKEDSFGGYSFKLFGKKYTLNDILTR